ncbi:MAG: right-handed parallel beta-helix repeat-containing protein [Rhizobacter sp.]
MAGSNANAGTSATSPKQNLSGINVNNLPAGSRLLFARGGAWTGFNVQLRNLNTTADSPMVFDAYTPGWGGTALPWLKAGGANFAFQFGTWNDTANDGGYVIRNLRLDGLNVAGTWGVHLRNNVHHVTLENLDISNFALGIHSGNDTSPGITDLVIRNNNVHHNFEMGMLGDANGVLIEGNTFAYNNASGSNFDHAIYLSGHGRNAVLRNNTFTNNSAVNGVCTGGNVTIHGQWDGLLIEGNTITQAASTGSCWGFSITPGYSTAEWFRNAIVRNNTITNLGLCAICAISAPGIVISSNKIINDTSIGQIAIMISTPGDSADAASDTPSITGNVVCTRSPVSSSLPVMASVLGAVVSGTVYRTGADATTGACAR